MHDEDTDQDVTGDVPEMNHPTFMTGAEFRALLVKTGAIGMWADRDDIGDTLAYARKLREQAQRRSRD